MVKARRGSGKMLFPKNLFGSLHCPSRSRPPPSPDIEKYSLDQKDLYNFVDPDSEKPLIRRPSGRSHGHSYISIHSHKNIVDSVADFVPSPELDIGHIDQHTHVPAYVSSESETLLRSSATPVQTTSCMHAHNSTQWPAAVPMVSHPGPAQQCGLPGAMIVPVWIPGYLPPGYYATACSTGASTPPLQPMCAASLGSPIPSPCHSAAPSMTHSIAPSTASAAQSIAEPVHPTHEFVADIVSAPTRLPSLPETEVQHEPSPPPQIQLIKKDSAFVKSPSSNHLQPDPTIQSTICARGRSYDMNTPCFPETTQSIISEPSMKTHPTLCSSLSQTSAVSLVVSASELFPANDCSLDIPPYDEEGQPTAKFFSICSQQSLTIMGDTTDSSEHYADRLPPQKSISFSKVHELPSSSTAHAPYRTSFITCVEQKINSSLISCWEYIESIYSSTDTLRDSISKENLTKFTQRLVEHANITACIKPKLFAVCLDPSQPGDPFNLEANYQSNLDEEKGYDGQYERSYSNKLSDSTVASKSSPPVDIFDDRSL